MSKKIFITGCAKSGTTLLLRMCYAFKNTKVLYREGFDGHELPFDEFVSAKSDEKFLIGKRHPPAILSNIFSEELDRQYEIIKDQNISIINVVRDGRDVILSDGKYVKPRRWIESIKQRDVFGDIIDLEVKYEDLVRKPNMVQEEMKTRFGLESYAKFSDYPDYVEDWVFDWNVSVLARRGIEEAKNNYGKRKVSDKSVGKDLEAYKTICSDLEINQFEACLRSLSYT